MALYSLIDENGARMPKSRLELANDLNIRGIEMGDDGLDLILMVLEGSGVIEKPAQRYQITHDYLAERVKEKSKGLLEMIEGRRRRAAIDRQRKEDEERRKKNQSKIEKNGHDPDARTAIARRKADALHIQDRIQNITGKSVSAIPNAASPLTEFYDLSSAAR